MTTTAGEQRRPLAPAARPVHTGSWFATFRHTLDRPLTSYYLLLTASTLLLAIGLMEVLSASSVDGYVKHGNSYYWFFRQLTWVLLALPVAFVATRLPHRALRGPRLAGAAARGGAARADPDRPRRRGQRQPQLAGPRPGASSSPPRSPSSR